MSQPTDRIDLEMDSHIATFLERLPAELGLERVLELSLKDPKHALAVLLEVRAALEREKRKAYILGALQETIASSRTAAETPARPAPTAPQLPLH